MSIARLATNFNTHWPNTLSRTAGIRYRQTVRRPHFTRATSARAPLMMRLLDLNVGNMRK